MNITFLVGNGFDISAGIDTSYGGFYKWYCSPSKDGNEEKLKWVKEFKRAIQEDMERPAAERTWSDFESGLGEYIGKFDTETAYQFIECYEDAVASLQQYIELQMKEKVQSVSEGQKAAFSKGLLTFTDELPDTSKENMKSMLPPKIKEDVWFGFVSFNYTSVLDKFVQEASEIPLARWTSGATYYARVHLPVLHVHGSVDNMPLMGVNDLTQIHNSILRDNAEVQQCMVKPIASAAVGTLVQQRAKEWIRESKIICLWGLSLGETDAHWWEEIMEWLVRDKSHQLIVFWHTGETMTRRLHTKFLKAHEKIYGKLFRYSSYANEDIEEAKKQIHIVFDTQKVLRVSLPDKEKELMGVNP
ncbi:MAG: hypothetical protein DBX91_09090 [Subdoligranulum variabile]|nr:MAG: hypothetical protein DBX91_09090 [Subdoligranulum variabile]